MVAFSSHDTLGPADLRFLRTVLEEVCLEKSVSLDGCKAAQIARELVNWYLFGIKHPLHLKAMLEPLVIEDNVA